MLHKNVGKLVIALGLSTSLVTSLTGCYQGTSLGGGVGKAGTSTETSPPAETKTNYAMVSPETLQSMLITGLGLTAASAPVTKVRNNYVALGGADPAQNVPSNSAYSSLKGKLVFEIFIDGCEMGMSNAAIKNRLFPNGDRDYNAIYLAFLGRSPTDDEKQVLDDLHNMVSDQIAPAAICGALLASVEPLNRT